MRPLTNSIHKPTRPSMRSAPYHGDDVRMADAGEHPALVDDHTADAVALRISRMEQLESHLPVETTIPRAVDLPEGAFADSLEQGQMAPTSQTRHRVPSRGCAAAGLAFALAVSQSDELESAEALRARRLCTSAISARTRSCRITFRAASPSAEDSSERQSSGRPAAMPRAPARSARSLSSGAFTLVHFDGKTHECAFDGHSRGIGGRLGQRVRNFVVGASHLDACNHGFAVRRFQPLECALVSFQRLAADCFFERGCGRSLQVGRKLLGQRPPGRCGGVRLESDS